MNVVFLKHITGTLVFAGLFFVSALFVSFCFPVDESKDEKEKEEAQSREPDRLPHWAVYRIPWL